MKKLAIVLGYVAMICIALFAFFKLSHVPGANVLVIAGCALFCLGFAPLWSWLRYKEAANTLNKVISVVTFLTLFFLGVSIIAKALYWGCGVINACIGYTFLILLIILVFIQALKEKDAWKSMTLHTFSILAGIALTLMTFLQLTTVPKCALYDFNCVISTQNKEIQYFTGKANSFFENFNKNAPNETAAGYYDKAMEVNTQCDSMIAMIRSMGEAMMKAADKQAIPFDSIQNLRHTAYVTDCKKACEKEGCDSLFPVKYEKFRAFIGENTNSRGKEILDIFFPAMVQDSTQQCDSECCSSCCCECTLICQLTDLNASILHVRMLQAETLNYLQTMQSKAMFYTAKTEEE